jgi:malate synthase
MFMMEDLATARMSAAQIAQRVRHSVRCADTGETHSLGMVREMMSVECHAACQHALHAESSAVSRGPREERYETMLKL